MYLVQEYLLLDRAVEIQRYSMQGKALLPSFAINASLTFARMLWCPAKSGGGYLACYDPDAEYVWILNANCQLISTIECGFRTRALYHESTANELVVVGPDQAVVRFYLFPSIYYISLNRSKFLLSLKQIFFNDRFTNKIHCFFNRRKI